MGTPACRALVGTTQGRSSGDAGHPGRYHLGMQTSHTPDAGGLAPALHAHPSGVGVVDKSVAILDALESGPATLAQLVASTGIARPTLHRLAAALTHHRLVTKDLQGRYVLGSRLAELASAAGEDRLTSVAGPVLQWLRDACGESAQVFRRQADVRVLSLIHI